MGRKSKRKTRSPADPEKIQRIRAVRQQDAQIRATLDRLHQTHRDLVDRVHYDKLAKQSDARLQALLAELPALFERRLALLDECFSANDALRDECEGLQRQLDQREGRPLSPDRLERIEAVLRTLPKEHQELAERMRLRITLGLALSKPVRVAPDVFEMASTYVASLETHVAAMRREMEHRLEIHAEAVQRGWAPRESLDTGRKGAEDGLLTIESGIPPLRDTLGQWRSENETLKQQQQNLRRALGRDSE